MYDAVVQQLAHRAEHQEGSAHVHHSDVSCQSGSIARNAQLHSKQHARNEQEAVRELVCFLTFLHLTFHLWLVF